VTEVAISFTMASDSSSLISLDSSISSGCILSVKVWIPEEKIPAFFELFKPAYQAVIAEPENRFFIVSRNPQEPTCLSWIEGWAKPLQWLLDVQLKKPYYEPYLSETEKWFLKDRWFEITNLEEGLGHFKLPENRVDLAGEIGEDI
jgi:quinol monooxygenase YgiN